MVEISVSVYCCEESLPIQRICATYWARSARAHRGSNGRSVAHPAELFLGGVPVIGICPGRHWAVHFWPKAHQSPYYHLFLGTETRNRLGHWRSMIDEYPFLLLFCAITTTFYDGCLYYVSSLLLFGS